MSNVREQVREVVSKCYFDETENHYANEDNVDYYTNQILALSPAGNLSGKRSRRREKKYEEDERKAKTYKIIEQ